MQSRLIPLKLYSDSDWQWSAITPIGGKYTVFLNFRCEYIVKFHHWYLADAESYRPETLLDETLDSYTPIENQFHNLVTITKLINEHHEAHIAKLFEGP